MGKFIYQYSAELEFSARRADGILEWQTKILGADEYRKAKSIIARNMFGLEDGTKIFLISLNFLGGKEDVSKI
jgi:hypothetical protein